MNNAKIEANLTPNESAAEHAEPAKQTGVAEKSDDAPQLPGAVTLEFLKKTHGEDAPEIFNAISKAGGYGVLASDLNASLDLVGIGSARRREKIEKILHAAKKAD